MHCTDVSFLTRGRPRCSLRSRMRFRVPKIEYPSVLGTRWNLKSRVIKYLRNQNDFSYFSSNMCPLSLGVWLQIRQGHELQENDWQQAKHKISWAKKVPLCHCACHKVLTLTASELKPSLIQWRIFRLAPDCHKQFLKTYVSVSFQEIFSKTPW